MASPVAIVTGASRGVGLEYSRALTKQGYKVAMLARSRDKLETVSKELKGSIYEVGDATDPTCVKKLVARAEQELGPVTAMVSNVGVWGPIGRTWNIETEEWWNAFTTNFKSALVATTSIMPHMIKRDSGKIILVSAQAGQFRWPLCAAYSTSKGAINKLAENLAWEIPRPTKVRIFSYNPGFLDIGISSEAHERVKSLDPDVQMTAKSVLQGFEKKKTIPPSRACDGLLQILSGKFDGKNGAYITVDDALAEKTG